MAEAVTVLGLCGSLRRHSFNRALLDAAATCFPDGSRMQVADLRGLPEFDEDLESAGEPAQVTQLKVQVATADVLLFATPEYNYSLPGWFKNVLDWLSRPPQTTPLRHKPAGIMTASVGERGGARAQLALRATLVYTDTYVMARPELFVGRAATKIDSGGAVIDMDTQAEVQRYVDALVGWARLVRAR